MLEMDCAAMQEICVLLRDKEYALRNYLNSLERRSVQEKDADPDDLRVLRTVIDQVQSSRDSLFKLILALEKTVQTYERSERTVQAILSTENRRLPDKTIGLNDLSKIQKIIKKYKIQTTG